MSDSVVFMFSGQGSQFYQMGRELFELHDGFRRWMLRLDAIVYNITHMSILDHIYDESKTISDQFDRTLYSHPAIFMVEYALAQILLERGIKPNYVLGTSMGEFASASIAGVISLEEALEALIEQAKALETHCQSGAMLAVLDDVSLYNETPLLYDNSELASVNFNSHRQIFLVNHPF